MDLSVLLIAVSCKCSTISLVTFVFRKKTHRPFQIDFYSTLLPYSRPGSHAREPREHPPGGVHAVPVQGPAHAPEPHGEHRVQPVPHRVSLDYGEFPQEVRRLLVPHPPHVYRGQLPGMWHHHQRPLLRRPLPEGHQHPGTSPAVHWLDGFCGGRGPDSYYQREQEAVENEEAPELLQASGV